MLQIRFKFMLKEPAEIGSFGLRYSWVEAESEDQFA
jgi:hypothetical protein